MEALLNNITAILGFGFLGLSTIFVILAYLNVKEVLKQDNPNQGKIALTKAFMNTALVFMIASGPLQWATVFIESWSKGQQVQIHLTVANRNWEDAFGEITLLEKGNHISLVNKTHTGTYSNDDEIYISAEDVIEVIREIRAQLTAATSLPPPAVRAEVIGPATGSEPPGPAPTSVPVPVSESLNSGGALPDSITLHALGGG